MQVDYNNTQNPDPYTQLFNSFKTQGKAFFTSIDFYAVLDDTKRVLMIKEGFANGVM